jgi:nicotinamidase-related amidase
MMAEVGAINGNTALVVVDVQVAVIAGEAEHHDAEGVLGRIAGLIDRPRAAGTPVIYEQHESEGYAPMKVGADGWQVHPAIAPLPEEPRVRKRACDSFYDTTLQSELTMRGIRSLVVCGCDSDYCVDTTVRSALSHGYDVTLVGDAHTTSDSDVLTAAQIIAHVNSTLDGLPIDQESRVVPAAEVVF